MTFQGETYARPGLSGRLLALLRVLLAGGTARFDSREQHGDDRARTRRESRSDGPLLWALVSFHLGLSALLAALYDTWFALLILVTQGVLCATWAFALGKCKRAMAGLERRARNAEEVAQAKSSLLATVSHELRAPLNGILGMSSLLSRTPLDARQSEQVETLRRCADTLLVMVNDALDFARLEAHKLPFEAAPFEPREAVDEVLAMNGPRAQEKGIELFAVVERNVPETVLGDATRVRQALTNLAANAVKFTAVGEVEVPISVPRPGRLRFSVSDTGIGIEPSARARLFAPFSQADGSISKNYGGSGLGLAISRRLVLAMGGSIDFESTAGIGSRFFFELPLLAEAAQAEVAAAPRKRNTVAVVVPHGGTREGLLEICAWLGHEVTCADNLSLLESPFDAAIVDGGLSPAELQGLASHPHRERILIISRATAEMPSWPRLSLSWPVRQSGLSGALSALLCARDESVADGFRSQPHERNVERFLAQPRVLLVEDTPVNQIVAEALLSELGVTVRVASDGDEALSLLHSELFELVLMDCQLPTVSGFETTRRLRASLGPNHRTPVLALTGNAFEGDEATCREAGMDDYLAKPIRRGELIDKLLRWLPARFCSPGDAAATDFVFESHPERASIPSNDVSLEAGDTDLVELEEFMLGFARQVGSSEAGRLATTYRESVPGTASSMSRALLEKSEEPDREALARHAHALRGAARSMGLKTLAQRLDELERVSASGELSSLRALTSDVETRIRVVCDALASREPAELRAASAREPNREAVG